MTTPALEITDLKKVYPNGVAALKGVSLTVEPGDFFALLGPNGAGKTTAIGIVTSLVNKTGGKVEVFGHDIDRELAIAKSCIGLVPQEINFNQFETVSTILINQAGFYGIPRRVAAVGKTQCGFAHAVGRHEAAADDRARADARAALADPR